MMLIVNGRSVETQMQEVSYNDIIVLAGYEAKPGLVFTITYRRGVVRSAEGSLTPGEKVATRNGMIFNCMVTGAA